MADFLNVNRTESRFSRNFLRIYSASLLLWHNVLTKIICNNKLLSILRVLPVIWNQIEKSYKFSQKSSNFTWLLTITLSQLSWLAQLFIWNLTLCSEHLQIARSEVPNSLFLPWNNVESLKTHFYGNFLAECKAHFEEIAF